MLQPDVVFSVVGFLSHPSFCGIEEFWEPGIKLDVRAAIAEHLIIQPRHFSGEDVSKQMVEITNFSREVISALMIVLHERIGLRPKYRLVDSIAPKQRRLHV